MTILEKASKLEQLRVDYISLVERPANRKGLVIKADDTFEAFAELVSKDAKRGLVYATVYEPFVEDTQNDYTDYEELETAAHYFLGEGLTKNVDQEHDYEADKGRVVESFILRGEDPNFVGTKKGAWCVVIQLTKLGLEHIDSIKGVSLAGSAIRKEDGGTQEEEFGTLIVRSRQYDTPIVRVRYRQAA